MDIYEALYTTRAMRRMKPDPIPHDVQARILDAAIRAPHVGEAWRFVLVDDPALKAQLAPLYGEASQRLYAQFGVDFDALKRSDTSLGRVARSADHLVHHFADVPLFLIGFAQGSGGSGIYPALWSAMLAARAEGVGSALTTMLQSFFADEVFDILGVPKDAGWQMHGTIPMGYPRGAWRVAPRQKPVHEVVARNDWQGDLGFTVPEPLWPR